MSTNSRLTDDQLERTATELLVGLPRYIWDGATLPIPIEDIADSQLGLLVKEHDALASLPPGPESEAAAISGLLVTGRREIWLNSDEAKKWPGRRRFTIAHEIGHWLLHRGREPDQIFCRASVVDPAENAEPACYPPREVEANVFAAALLMPAPIIRMKYEEMRRRDLEFEWLCEKFGASGAAMGRRLHRVIESGSG